MYVSTIMNISMNTSANFIIPYCLSNEDFRNLFIEILEILDIRDSKNFRYNTFQKIMK